MALVSGAGQASWGDERSIDITDTLIHWTSNRHVLVVNGAAKIGLEGERAPLGVTVGETDDLIAQKDGGLES